VDLRALREGEADSPRRQDGPDAAHDPPEQPAEPGDVLSDAVVPKVPVLRGAEKVA